MMEVSLVPIFDFGVATGLICVMLAAVITSRRRRPYTHQDLVAAMDRICDDAQELWTVLDADCGLEALARHDDKALRAKCSRMLQDILRNTCYILDRAEPCSWADRRREMERVEINRCAADVVRRCLRLIFYVRWTQLRIALQPDAGIIPSCRQTLTVAAKYTCLWMAVVALLEAKFPECREKVAHAG